ncbi:DMT family transporter [Thermoanaerobacteraceae bacterium SP2]|nr:DMT family transporter [Thermoanaerobacteraceae bacterium SP2]
MILLSITKDIFFLLVAFMAGVAMATQGSMNSALSKAIGLSEATFVVHFSATVVMLIILILGISHGNWGNYSQVPWYYYLGGFIGVLITYGVVVSIPKLGVAVATTAIIVGQVLTACLVDHFGFFGLEKVPFTWLKFLGLVFLSIGAKLLLN